MMTITYVLRNSLYVNITNRCTNRCSFCIRNTDHGVGEGIDLWLDREPTVREIIDDIEKHDLNQFKELVFCGYGEPMFRTEEIVEICKYIRSRYSIKIRINTNGHANLIHGYDVTPILEGLVDCVSISLNAKNAAEYQNLCHSVYGERAYEGMLDFALKCKKYVPEVVLSVVDVMSPEDIKTCEQIAGQLGVGFRVRKYSS